MVGTEGLLYFGGWQHGEMVNSHPKTNSKDSGLTMKVFKGRIIQGKGQNLCYRPLCTDFLSVFFNNFESVANLSTVRSFTSESTFFIS